MLHRIKNFYFVSLSKVEFVKYTNFFEKTTESLRLKGWRVAKLKNSKFSWDKRFKLVNHNNTKAFFSVDDTNLEGDLFARKKHPIAHYLKGNRKYISSKGLKKIEKKYNEEFEESSLQ